MKKIKLMMMLTLILVILTSVCYGAVPEEASQPLNLTVFRYTPTFEIDSNGNAYGTLTVRPYEDGILDEVVALFEVEHVDSEERVFRQSKGLIYSQSRREFFGEVEFDVENRGQYEMNIVFYCYSEDRLVETIRTNAVVRQY